VIRTQLIGRVLAIGLALGAGAAVAAPACPHPLTVAISPLGRDMEIGQNGSMSGTTVEILKKVEQRTGCPFEFRAMPRVRAWHLYAHDEIDIVPSAIRTPDRDKFGTFVPWICDLVALVTLKDQNIHIRSVADLIESPITVDVVRGFDFGPDYQQLLTDKARAGLLRFATDVEQTVAKLAHGRTQGLLATVDTIIDPARKYGIEDQLDIAFLDGIPPVVSGIYLRNSAGSAEEREALLSVLRAPAIADDYRRLTLSSFDDSRFIRPGFFSCKP